MPINKVKKHIAKKVGCDFKQIKLSPNPEFGDLTLECFELAKQLKKKPDIISKTITREIATDDVISKVSAIGPYINFRINYKKFANSVLEEILEKQDKYGKHDLQKKQTIMLEFAHPNTHKEFHIGHLRNIITGESLVRILENAGYKVIRANYQGDVGLHIAKCLWGVEKLKVQTAKLKVEEFNEKIKFLSKAYVLGNKYYEEDKDAKGEIQELNKQIYNICKSGKNSKFNVSTDENIASRSLEEIYHQTRQWSLDYFDKIYKRLNVKFDRLYFESEVFKKGKEIVLKNLKKDIFKKSKGAIIFEGEKHGLHIRVFVNSKGLATYEAKDLALAKLQFKEYNPDKIIHLVSKEQIEYFKVLFKALEQVMPKSKNREMHLSYGWVGLKRGKMSSRSGKIVLAEWLLDKVEKLIMKISKNAINRVSTEKIAQAAIKYSILKTGIQKDMSFDIKQSINLSGNSGPYLQYTYARIQSILRKYGKNVEMRGLETRKCLVFTETEKQLILKLSLFPEITAQAAAIYEPSLIAKYLFDLAQVFNDYYQKVPILKSKEQKKYFRLALISAIAVILKKGMNLLGIETVETM